MDGTMRSPRAAELQAAWIKVSRNWLTHVNTAIMEPNLRQYRDTADQYCGNIAEMVGASVVISRFCGSPIFRTSVRSFYCVLAVYFMFISTFLVPNRAGTFEVFVATFSSRELRNYNGDNSNGQYSKTTWVIQYQIIIIIIFLIFNLHREYTYRG